MVATKTKTLKVKLDRARGLLVQLGLPTAKRIGAAKVLGKLSALDAEDDTADPGKYKRLYTKIVDANAQGVDIVIDDSEEEEKPTGGKAPAKTRTRKGTAKKPPAKARTRKASTKGTNGQARKSGAKKAAKKRSAPSGAGKDQYGARIGGNPNLINEALRKAGKKGLTFAEICEEVGVSLPHANSHVYNLRNKGYAKSVSDGRNSRHVIKRKV